MLRIAQLAIISQWLTKLVSMGNLGFTLLSKSFRLVYSIQLRDHVLLVIFEYHTGSCIGANYYLAMTSQSIRHGGLKPIAFLLRASTKSSSTKMVIQEVATICPCIANLLHLDLITLNCRRHGLLYVECLWLSIIWLFCLGSKHLFVPCGTTRTPWLEKITHGE
jgi:hypothetical protein